MSRERDMHYIYKITFPDGKYYIGCTYDLKARLYAHLNKPYDNSKVSEYMVSSGYTQDDIEIEVLRQLMYKGIAKRVERGIINKNYYDDNMINNPRFKPKEEGFKIKMPNGEITYV